jgi:glycosyltransferase involved in cell wall biosynthesis
MCTGSFQPEIAVIIPANNEEDYIDACLEAVCVQQDCPPMLVIVSANACTDATVSKTLAFQKRFAALGCSLECLDRSEGGKLGALNAAEAVLTEKGCSDLARLYLDADIICDPKLIGLISETLSCDAPRYATGQLIVTRAQSLFTRLYARFWQSLPFVQSGAVGVGCFAVNGAGRARWDGFPDIISDDTFVRLNFTPDERVEVKSAYHWPMIEGFARLVRVRRRQDAGVIQLAELHPELLANEGKASLTRQGLACRALRMPASFIAYMAVHIGVRLSKGSGEWSRGR